MIVKRKLTSYVFWTGEKLHSQRGLPLAFDVETEAVQDERQIAQLAIAVASDGQHHVVIHPDDVGNFLDQHRDEHFVGHNVQFDFWVIDQHLVSHPARRVLWDACDQGRLRDTMILDMLIQLGTGGYRTPAGKAGAEEQKVYPTNLANLAADFTTLQLNKEDPYRLRFGELIGMSQTRLQRADSGFFEYAVADVVATQRLYPALTHEAEELMLGYGYDRGSNTYEILPDAIDRYGYLSEAIQVKASIVLAHMYRRGVNVDRSGVQQLLREKRQRVAELTSELKKDYPKVLTYDREGGVRLTAMSQTPSLSNSHLTETLQQVVEEMRQKGESIQVPYSQGKQRGVSRSVKEWAKFQHLHRFIALWIELKSIEKQLGILSRMDAPTLHCQYGLLTRTGRTSCSSPRDKTVPGINLQQVPNDSGFRGLVTSRMQGGKLLVADYSAIELRTLGAVCLARFGHSRLAEVIRDNVDPHAFTAAAIQGIRLDEFMALKATDSVAFRQRRQAAKAINFGVPGGLGAKTLKEYAQANYGVSLSEGDAEEFRRKLITEIYPELNDRNGYLADPSMVALSRNLGVPESLLWDAFDWSGEKKSIAARGVANVIAGRSNASADYQKHVWAKLRRLCDSCEVTANDVRDAINAERGNEMLHRRLYHQKVATLTGRIRDGVKFTDSKNTPFQSLAADGSKLALWRLLHAGFDVYGFVHDEILINLPVEATDSDALRAVEIMQSSMEEVLGGIPAKCAWTVSDRWKKPD
jgi:DNA polymerase I-like protein with 3'-5' exonuclease and polymerase domains